MHSLIADQRINVPSELLLLRGYEIVLAKKPSEGRGSNAPGNMLRLSVGLEHPGDLIEDLLQALA